MEDVALLNVQNVDLYRSIRDAKGLDIFEVLKMVTKTATSFAQVQAILENQARKAMEDASEEILEKFKKKYVEKFAYAKGQPVEYPRGFEFRDSWIWTRIKESAKTLSMEMFNNFLQTQTPSARGKAPFINTTFAANSKWPSDSRPHMASYLENLNTDIFLTGNREGGYWSKFVAKELKGGGLLRIIKKHAKANGFVRGSASIS